MAEWLVEEGIGEHRAIRLTKDGIEEARVQWPGAQLVVGEVADAILRQRLGEGSAGLVEFPNGQQAFGTLIPRRISIGALVRMRVTREAIAERGRLKLAQARHCEADARPALSLAEALREEGHDVEITRRFPASADWDELWLDAARQQVDFHGGALLFAETPAMTLIDVDGGPDRAIWSNAIPVMARALKRFDLGGNIGIDFPTVQDKSDRKVIDARLEECLQEWPHERTAMNGFGLVQIVARLERPSLLHRIARHRAAASARLLLRRAEAVEGAGAILLTCHPAVAAELKPEWLTELARRTGREVRIEPNPGLALEAPHAQIVTR
ncbi:ribonuclease [Altererythrobacter sp. BO-6]|uniref:ribonuclease E/G n=1 Tax=Altererythrobacter sp. BO-6 TaxID=2604537 RepID=UPI0013E1BD26|nr:ribonuclease E/G [Altererythrobacter sp. BO-6]QIG53377.1 ribonuclease [Altererythrobacter sp. BO-6]